MTPAIRVLRILDSPAEEIDAGDLVDDAGVNRELPVEQPAGRIG